MSFDSEKRRHAHIIGKKERRAQRVSDNLMCTQILVDSYVCTVYIFLRFTKAKGLFHVSCLMTFLIYCTVSIMCLRILAGASPTKRHLNLSIWATSSIGRAHA